MPYGPAQSDTDGFVCDGEWVSRSRPSSFAERVTDALEEWQESLDGDGPLVPLRNIPLDGLKHGGSPSPGGGTWRYRRRG